MTPKELDDIRKGLGLSVNAFAKAIYRDKVTMRNLLSGRSQISDHTAFLVRLLAEMVKIDPKNTNLPEILKNI